MAGLITRFAPSPTGLLHLGHAFSALTAWDIARTAGGRFRLRIEDIDRPRCKPEFERAIFADLHWLGLHWPQPILRQSQRMAAYADALRKLSGMGLTYRCICTRGDIRAAASAPQEGARFPGPDGPVYPGTCRHAGHDDTPESAIRLDMRKALQRAGPAGFYEDGPRQTGFHPLESMEETIGDIVLARRDIGTSYHLSVVIDDAHEGITLVTRGTDLFEATPVHVLLQRLLGLPTPQYHHHRLIRDAQGKRLAKSDAARALARYRAEGATPADIRSILGL